MVKFNENRVKNEENLKNSINFKKSLGQNFLFDTNLLNAIASDGGVRADDTVLEIGAGAGTLTAVLASRCKKVISFEIDKSLMPILNGKAEQYKNIEFHFMDFMEADIDSLGLDKAKVVANIPYYITTPIIFRLVEHIEKFDSVLVLIQKEVAERFASPCGNKNYGVTSVILQSIFDVSIPRIIRKECFTPSPKIDSALCLLVPHDKYCISDFAGFRDFVHLSFSMRRKTLVNNLKSKFDKDKIILTLEDNGYNANTRPEEISVEKFIKIFENLKK
ncbi:MAG: ribosomal RNA small subunit methyltransferase A [Clostridiales bacterium]|nr:ribosomal RNA small subunit methyltransferase A [Clostridiales bacterium]